MNAPLVRRSPAHRAQVVDVVDLTPRMRRVTVVAESMVGTQIRPAQDVELLLREQSGRRVKRRYTIRTARPDYGQFDLDVLLHGDTIGSGWAINARPGDEVEFQGPRGKLQLRPATAHLLLGDESALPAIASICEALPAEESAIALVEVDGPDDELPLDADVRWIHRRAGVPVRSPSSEPRDPPAGEPDLLRAALADVDIPRGTHGYLMGESRAMIALRAELEQRGIDHDAIFVKGYWNLGRPDRLAGRSPR